MGIYIERKQRILETSKHRNIEIEYIEISPNAYRKRGSSTRYTNNEKFNYRKLRMRRKLNREYLLGVQNDKVRFTIHTGLNKTPFELHHGRKPRNELTNNVNYGKSYLSDWSELSVLEQTEDTNLRRRRWGWRKIK